MFLLQEYPAQQRLTPYLRRLPEQGTFIPGMELRRPHLASAVNSTVYYEMNTHWDDNTPGRTFETSFIVAGQPLKAGSEISMLSSHPGPDINTSTG